jgi:hypothetical protein
MRGLTSTIILVVVLAGLVGYIYFVDRGRPPSGTETKAKAFDVSPENIEEVVVKNAAGETTRVRRIDANWKIVEPQDVDADAAAVASVTSGVAGLEVQRVVDENPTDVKQYGLDPPRMDVSFRVKDQKEFQQLLVGEKTPTGGDLYARKPGENRVFLISSFLDATFNKTAFDFRDKLALKFERDLATGLEVVQGGTTLALAREGTEWKLSKPIAGRADYATVEGIMTRLQSAQMQKVVAEQAGDLRQYGLDRPTHTVTVTTGSSRATLLLGKSDEAALLAKDASRPMVFTVEQSLATDLTKELADFRRKDVFDSRSFTTNKIDVRRGAETLTFQKTTADGKDVWKNAAGQNVDDAKIQDLMTKLSSLRASSFETTPPAALKTPVLTVSVVFDEKKMETVTFGRAGSDVFASRPDEPGAAKLEATAFDDTMKALDAVK